MTNSPYILIIRTVHRDHGCPNRRTSAASPAHQYLLALQFLWGLGGGYVRAEKGDLSCSGAWRLLAALASGETPIPLQAGDLLVLPRDKPHRISSLATPPGPDVPLNRPSANDGSIPSTGLICGYFEFESRAWNPIIEALPEAIVLRKAGDARSKSVDTLIRLMVDEAAPHPADG